jgi:hypothetical protein
MKRGAPLAAEAPRGGFAGPKEMEEVLGRLAGIDARDARRRAEIRAARSAGRMKLQPRSGATQPATT